MTLPFPEHPLPPEKSKEEIKSSVEQYIKDRDAQLLKEETEMAPYKAQLMKTWESTNWADIALDRSMQAGIPKRICLNFYSLQANKAKSVMPLK